MKNLINQKGITLIALVVTIVILLILADVSLNAVLSQNGLINNAKEAKEQTKSAVISETGIIDNTTDWISETVNNTSLPQTDETKPYMPSNEFSKVVGTNLANGLTIQDSTGNQYVWVEVPMTEEVYPTAKLKITKFNEDVYTQIENDLQSYTSTYKNNSAYKDKYYDDTNNTLDWFNGATEYNKAKQKMLKSIYQNGGFWVARYEAGIEKNRYKSGNVTAAPLSKPDLYPYTYVTRTQAQKLAEMVEYGANENKHSGSLMFGIQWDLILKFIENKKIETDSNITTKLTSDSIDIGNYSNSTFKISRGKYITVLNWVFNSDWTLFNIPTLNYVDSNSYKLFSDNGNGILLTTGASDQNNTMNIYDIAGNVREWTLESYSDSLPCVNRGGGFSNTSSFSTSYRNGRSVSNNDESIGFRICLY